MNKWDTYTVQELIDLGMLDEPLDGNHGELHPKVSDYVKDGIPFIMANDLKNGTIDYKNCAYITLDKAATLKKGFAKPGDVLLTHKATIGRTAIVPDTYSVTILTPQITYYRTIKGINNRYLKYYFDSYTFQQTFKNWAGSGSTRAYLGIKEQHKLPIIVPPMPVQDKIVSVLGTIDDKIEENVRINQNLEQQMQSLFNSMFAPKISNVEENRNQPLGDLITIIDNRGKTPPLEHSKTAFPVIDVKALSGKSRIIDFNNCSKYVSEDTYNNWFRSGHPEPKDILISTVGSLAEMKMFFGTDGCIAQNVVGFRTRQISPYYLYQYLLAIKNDLVAYNIGSVQPSIKVTHIIKHPIYIPEQEEIDNFDKCASNMTEIIYQNYKESNDLALLRDTLLPKLMSGELDVSALEI